MQSHRALERRSVSWMAGSAATKLCAGDSPCSGEPPSGESPPVEPCQLSFEMPCGHAQRCRHCAGLPRIGGRKTAAFTSAQGVFSLQGDVAGCNTA